MDKQMNKTIIPRNFKLMDEYEKRGAYADFSYGLIDDDDMLMTEWHGMIFGQDGCFDKFKIVCDENYPNNPPIVSLMETKNNKIRNLFVSGTLSKNFPIIRNWAPNKTISDVLGAIHAHCRN